MSKLTYQQALKIAYKIYDEAYGKPKDHYQWAQAFNIRAKIVKIIMSERI